MNWVNIFHFILTMSLGTNTANYETLPGQYKISQQITLHSIETKNTINLISIQSVI